MPSKSNKLRNRNVVFSINIELIDKIPPHNKRFYKEGFSRFCVPLDTLADEVISKGVAYSYVFKDEIRKSENFEAADFISVDFDGGISTDEALKNSIVKKHASLFYTTSSHTPDHHKFRLIFILPYTLTDPREVVAASRSLTRQLDGDMAATDAARMFFGSSRGRIEKLPGCISKAFLKKLIDDGKINPQNESISQNTKTSNRATTLLDISQSVRLASGAYRKLENIKLKTSIYCPYHNDRKPSAFVARNPKGKLYLYCSKCLLTRWEPHYATDFDFNDFENTVLSLKQRTSKKEKQKKKEGLERFKDFGISKSDILKSVVVQNQRYLKIDDLTDGLTFIRSPKGTGKTTFLKNAVRKYTERFGSFEEYEKASYDCDPQMYTNKKVLLIGHRQALIGELCSRLGLSSYLDDKNFSEGENEERKKRYGICLDSILKVTDQKYDLIIIDESEQILSHFLSETVGLKRERLFHIFSKLLKSAERVVTLDADLGWLTFDTITSVLADKPKTETLEHKKQRLPIKIYINQWKQKDRKLTVFSDKYHLITDLLSTLLNGKRCFVASNSKRLIKALDAAIRDEEKVSATKIRRIAITSENSKNKAVQSFILDIKNKVKKYDAILSSPSLGTGIDINFENDAQEIDVVYGFFETRINTHFDIDQQISRVRNPKEVKVWVSPQQFNFETDFGAVQLDLQKAFLYDIAGDNYHLLSDSSEYKHSPFLRMASQIVATQRASKNKLKLNFIRYKAEQSWIVLWEPVNKQARKEGKNKIEEAKSRLSDEEMKRILVAEPLNLYFFQKAKDAIEHL